MYSHSIQNEELILLLHQRATPAACHFGDTVSFVSHILSVYLQNDLPVDTPN